LICDSRDLQITPQIIREGVWEPVITALYERLIPNGGTYLEIGANIGYFTSLAVSHVGHYGTAFAYEPHPRAFHLLQENLRLNRQSYLATVKPLAVADRPGKRLLNSFVHNLPSSTLATLADDFRREMYEESCAIEVDCTTLDAEFSNTDLKFDVVKIDAEGSEPLILAGASAFLSHNFKSDAVLMFEWNPVAMRSLGTTGKMLLDVLAQHGLHVFKIQSDELLSHVRRADELDGWNITDLLATRAIDALHAKGFRTS
jgi:FkbM family methyltransferase